MNDRHLQLEGLENLKVLLQLRKGTAGIEAYLFATIGLEPDRPEMPSMFSLVELERLWDMELFAARGTENLKC